MTSSRYLRQTMMPEIGEEGQLKLLKSKVLIVGVGGLGSLSSMYLTGAGIGCIGIVDCDVVNISNLPRQVLYNTNQQGQSKVECATQRLRAMNPDVTIVPYNLFLGNDNAQDIVAQYDIVLDACDNFATRYLLSDVCQQLQKPFVYGAIRGLEGQVSVFFANKCGDNSISYRSLFPDSAENVATKNFGKEVLGPTAALIASVQTAQVIKLICGFGETLVNKLFTFDLGTLESKIINF